MARKAIVWDNPNKMHIDTGHKTFDRQTRCISTCASISSTQFGGGVRPVTEIMNAGIGPFAHGELQKYDLGQWHKDAHPAAKQVAKKYADKLNKSVMLHHFFHRTKGKKYVHGYAVTSGEKILAIVYNGFRYKSNRVVDVCCEYLGETTSETERIYRFY